MKKIYKFFSTALCFAGLLLSSCMKDADALDVTVSSVKTLRATTELASRTTLDGDYNVIWSEGDRIVVFGITDADNNEGKIFTLAEGAGTADGMFTGSLDDEYTGYYAMYPYSMFSEIYLSGRYAISLPTGAVFTERNFVKDANPMIAYGTESGGLAFKNLCGIAEFQITGSGTVNTIQVVSGDGQPVSGKFYADPKTLELSPVAGDENYTYIYATLESPIELSQTPRSVYAILPSGTYSNLSIRTIDDNGTLTTRTAKNDITVTRSHIVPVSQFTHTEKTVPYLAMAYLEEHSNFYRSQIQFQTNSAASGFHYRYLTYDNYEAMVAEGKSDFEILAANSSAVAQTSITMGLSTLGNPDGKHIILGLPFDANGEFDQTNITKLVFSSKRIPFTDEISVSIYGEPEITENSVRFTILQDSSFGQYKVLYSNLEKNVYDSFTEINLQSNVLLGYSTALTSGQSLRTVSIGDLLPDYEYVFAFSATDGIMSGGYSDIYTRYANIETYTYRTLPHTPSDATVELAISEIADWNANISATASAGASKIKYYLTYSDNISADIVARSGTEMDVDASGNVIELQGLTEETAYYLYAVAYDENGSYGVASSISFTTTPLKPASDAEYDKFIGKYEMTFTIDSNGETSRDVTIGKGVEGKTFIVKGLISPSIVSRYSLDDTVTARFENGEFCLYCQEIASAGTLAANYGNVYINLYNGTYLWYNPEIPLRSTYDNGVITPRAEDENNWNGIYFSAGISGPYLEYFTDFVLTKKTGTEGFDKDDETNAGWN